MGLAENIEKWKQEWRNEGLLEGRQLAGQARLLQRMLTGRFGPLPPERASRIASAPVEDIHAWADRLLCENTLEEIFRT